MNPWRGLRGLPREAWVLFAAMLVNRAGTMALPFLVLYLTRSRGLPAETAGLALLWYGLGSLVTGPLAGRLSDRIGTRRVMVLSLFVSGLLVMTFPLLGSLRSILAVCFIWSVTAEAFRPASLSSLAHAAGPGQRKAVFALARLAVNLGMSIGPLAGGFLARVSYPSLFVVDGITSIAAGFVLLYWLPRSETGGPQPERSVGAAAWVPSFPLVYFLAAILPVMMVFFQLSGALPLFVVHDLGLDESALGLVLTVNTILIIFLEVPLNLRMASWPHGRTLALGALLTGVGFGALVLTNSFVGVALTVVVWTFGEMILLPGATAYVAEIAPPEKRGAFMGYYQMAFSLSLAAGSSGGAVILGRYGPRVLWPATLVCGILSALLLARVRVLREEPS